MALRNDGKVEVYRIQTRTDTIKNSNWYYANLDHFGKPKGFGADGECWQETGIKGTFSWDDAIDGHSIFGSCDSEHCRD